MDENNLLKGSVKKLNLDNLEPLAEMTDDEASKALEKSFARIHWRIDRLVDKLPFWLGWGLYHRYNDITFWIRNKYQVLTRGYSDYECWAFDYHMAKWAIPRLKGLRANLSGNPPDITFEEWEAILDDIIFAFEFHLKEDDYIIELCYPKDYNWGFNTKKDDDDNYVGLIWKDDREPDYSKIVPLQERAKRGMEYFVKYYGNLWD
jgi:hypothetical protein